MKSIKRFFAHSIPTFFIMVFAQDVKGFHPGECWSCHDEYTQNLYVYDRENRPSRIWLCDDCHFEWLMGCEEKGFTLMLDEDKEFRKTIGNKLLTLT
jgi:hypothetical protein